MTAGARAGVSSRPAASVTALRWFAAAVALGMGARLAIAIGLDVTPESDAGWYYGRALELLATGRYAEAGVPTAYWPVGYPAFLAATMAVFGSSVVACKLMNVLLSGLCIALLYAWCLQRWPGNRTVAGAAAALFALYPNQIGHSGALLTEPLFTALLLAMCLVAGAGRSWRHVAGAGLIAGLAALVKTQTMLLAPLLLAILWCPAPKFGDALRAALLATGASVAMACVIAPWTWRNHVELGAFVPISTNGGMSLLAGNNPAMTTDLSKEYSDDSDLVRSVGFSVKDQVAADQRARRAAWGWISANPGFFMALMPKKFLRLWLWDGESEWLYQHGYAGYEQHRMAFRVVRGINQVFYLGVLALLVAVGWRGVEFRRPDRWDVPFMLAFFTALCLVFSGQSRYHAPLMPFVMALACYGVWHRTSGRKRNE